jgi:hypothetical protein
MLYDAIILQTKQEINKEIIRLTIMENFLIYFSTLILR